MTEIAGRFPTKTLSPVYAGGMPLGAVADSLAANEKGLSRQRQTSESRFWSSPPRPATSDIREVFEVNLNGPQWINRIAFDLARFPHDATVEYFALDTQDWTAVQSVHGRPLTIAVIDSVPAVILPALPSNEGHPQHYGAGHWVHYDHRVVPVEASRFRVVLARRAGDKAPVDQSGLLIDYSLGVKDFNLGYQVRSRADIPRAERNPENPSETVAIATATDLLGSPIDFVVRENRAADLARGLLWRSEPQPISQSVVSLYLDVRDDHGRSQVIDSLYVDPVTSGPNVNLYFTNDPEPSGAFRASDDLLATTTTGTVEPTETGLDFVDPDSHLDIANLGLQFDPTRPFWLGLVIQPHFDSGNSQRFIVLDSGGLLVEWTGSSFQATYGGATLPCISNPFAAEDQVRLVVGYDGQNLLLRVNSSSATVDVLGRTAVTEGKVRVGGLLSGTSHGNFLLLALVLKDQAPPAASEYTRLFNDPAVYLTRAPYERQDTGTTDNAILRYLPTLDFVGGVPDLYSEMVWTPITRDYRLRRGSFRFNEVRARHFKLEFSNLSPQPYDPGEPVVRNIKVFPQSAYFDQRYRSLTASGNAAGGGVAVMTDAAGAQVQYADQRRLFTNIQVVRPDSTYTPTETLYASNPLLAARLREKSLYYNFQQWHHPPRTPRFAATQKHVYDTVEVEHTSRLAFFVAIQTIRAYRSDPTVDDDTARYVETFLDTDRMETDPGTGDLVGGWDIDGQGLFTPDNFVGPAIATSKVFSSQRRLRGIQFAAQQSPPIQLLTDPDFNDETLSRWEEYGDANIGISSDFNTDLGTLTVVDRSSNYRYWNGIERKFGTWDGIEESHPDSDRPTWDELQTIESSGDEGGIQSTEMIQPILGSRVYGAVRVFSPTTLEAPVYVQIVDADNDRVLAQEPIEVIGGRVTEWYVGYTAGEGSDEAGSLTWDQMEWGGLFNDNNPWLPDWNGAEEKGTWDEVGLTEMLNEGSVYVRVAQLVRTADKFYVDTISMFEDSVSWEVSHNGGYNWYRVNDIRNDANGVFLFPSDRYDEEGNTDGFELRWRVISRRPNQRVSGVVMRPWYTTLPLGVPHRETIQFAGPNEALYDHMPPIKDDPHFKMWDKPIPENWFFAHRQWLLHQTAKTPVIEDRGFTMSFLADTLLNE